MGDAAGGGGTLGKEASAPARTPQVAPEAQPGGRGPDEAQAGGRRPDEAQAGGRRPDEASHVLLVGMMGSGKTTVGRLLAARLGRPFLDSDALVTAATGRSVPEIFASEGEAAFRRAEAEALASAVASGPPAVVAVAGGAVLSAENRRRIREGGVVVWLRARPSTLARRVGTGEGRPLLSGAEGGPLAALERLDAVRRPLYAEVADAVVDVDDRPPAGVAAAVAAKVAALCGRGGRSRAGGAAGRARKDATARP